MKTKLDHSITFVIILFVIILFSAIQIAAQETEGKPNIEVPPTLKLPECSTDFAGDVIEFKNEPEMQLLQFEERP